MRILLLSLVLILIPSFSAEAKIIQNSVWLEPSEPKAGEKVILGALVRNSTTKTITYTVVFSDNEKAIGTKSVQVPSGATRPATIEWTASSGEHELEAYVSKAVEANGKVVESSDIEPAHTVTINIGGAKESNEKSKVNIPIPEDLKEKGKGLLGKIDAWRLKKLSEFKEKRDSYKAEVDTAKTKDNQTDIADPNSTEIIPSQAPSPSWGVEEPLILFWYLVFFLLVFIFSSTTIFYGTALLLAFLVIRGVFSRFV